MANGIYKAVMKSRYQGQQHINVLWYRSVLEGTFASDLLIDGARALGLSIISHIWQSALRISKPSGFYFDGVEVVGYNDQFELLYNNSIFVPVESELAEGTGGPTLDWLPPGNCVNIAFSLKNRLISNPLFKPPHKGLVSLSPVNDAHVGNDGTLNDDGMARFDAIAAAFAAKLPWDFVDIDLPFTGWQATLGLPDAFVPMRAKVWELTTPEVIGGITLWKHIETTDIESATPRKVLGYRRSRKVEG